MGKTERTCVAFIGNELVAEGDIVEVALKVKALTSSSNPPLYLVFDVATGRQIDLDLSGTEKEIAARITRTFTLAVDCTDAAESDSSARKGVGRPKLGVVSREVTLLPRHWEWLNDQPGGASVALRKLVEEAKKTHADRARIRHSQEAAYRFMSAKAGNLEGFEEAIRALFRADRELFVKLTEGWPADVRYFSRKLANFAQA